MKGPGRSGSLHRSGGGGLVPLPPEEEKTEFGRLGSFHSIVDGSREEEEEEILTMTMGEEETGVVPSASSTTKKRRLCAEQVKALEKYFEVDNKLEPERKVKLARELGLQPRQVAVWFQNRRARWKIKQLERDYCVLKGNYDALKSNYDGLVHGKESLLAEITELKSKLEQAPQTKITTGNTIVHATVNCEADEQDRGEDAPPAPPPLISLTYKDGSSDSDSSAILNDFSPPPRTLSHHIHQLATFNCTSPSPSTSSPFQHDDRRDGGFSCHYYSQPEESQFQPCGGFFSVDKPATPLPSAAPITGVDEAWWWRQT